MIGQNIGKYRVVDRIGKGGMGTVYRAMDEMLHREVAIKVLNAELNDPEVAKRFRAEAITVARLSHPGIATIYELFEHEGQWLMVMEFVRGETFENMVARMGPLSAQRSAELCMQALAALAHAHSMGVVHRDLKPANLMITENGAVKVMDFGIARVSGSEHLTNAGFMMGTPAYMAPEQVRGGEVDARADLYALGVVFYRLTTARLPFKGDTAFAMVHSQVHEPPTPIGLHRADLPNWVSEIVTRALAKAPEHRFQSAAEFHEALARCMAGLPISSMYAAGDTGMTPARMPSGAFSSRAMPTPSAAFPVPMSPPPESTQMASGPTSAEFAAATAPTVLSRSGATARPDQTATSTPAAGPATAQGQSTIPPAATLVVKKPIPVMWIGVAGAAVLAVVVAAMMMKGGSTTVQPPPAATAEPTPTPPPAATDPATGGSATTTPDPAQTAVPPPVASPSAATPKPGESPAPSPSAGRSGAVTPAPTPTGATGAAAASGRPVGAPAGADADPLATFSDVKMYEISGKRAIDRDVVLNFVGGQLAIAPKTGGAALISLPYRRVTHATYVRARDPKWNPKLASPPEGFDAGSFIGTIIRSARHWLVVQGSDHFEILRLEDSNVRQILETLEKRTGVKIDRQ